MSDTRVAISMNDDGIADVRLNRPDKMNALDSAMFAAIAGAIETLQDMKGLRAVVLSGEGRAFCAGLDLSNFAPDPDRAPGQGSVTRDLGTRSHGVANLAQHVAWGWRLLPVPVIAAAHGVTFGGGFQILSGADVRFIHPATRCAIMEMKWGLVPDMAGFPLWRGNVRQDVLRQLIYTNEEFSGIQAQAYGFATHVSESPLEDAMALARTLAGKHPAAMRSAKRLCNAMSDTSDDDLLQLESSEQQKIIRTPDQIEAVMAQMQKRAPVFAG